MKTKIKRLPLQFALQIKQINQPLDYKHLSVLNLSGLHLQTVEISVNNLLTLILDCNNLQSFDIEKQFPNLQTLSIAQNQITEFDVPKSLRVLNISQNKLKTIHLQNLVQLDASSNQLQQIYQNQHNQLSQLKLGLLTSLNQNEVWEHLTIKHFTQNEITIQQFIQKAIDLLISYGLRKENQLFDKQVINSYVLQNDKYNFEIILPFLQQYKQRFTNDTPLYYAIKQLKMQFVNHLIEIINIQDEIESFHEAIKQGQTALVKHFIELGIDSNLCDQKGLTPLTTAILNITQVNMDTIIQLLIQSKANPNKLNNNGLSLIQMCIIKSNLTALKFIMNINKKKSTKIKFKMNIKSQNGDYPLHLAINSVSITQFFLNHSIGNVLKQNYQNLTPKQMSIPQNRLIILKLLSKEENITLIKQFQNSINIVNKRIQNDKDKSSESSCPELSDDEMPNKPKINRKFYTDADELSFDVRQQSEDENNYCSSESEIHSPKENLKSLKLVQLNFQNNALFRSNKDVRQKSILLNKINKRRLSSDQFNYFTRENQTIKEKVQSIFSLRYELGLFTQVKQFSELLSQEYQSYLSQVNQSINNLEAQLECGLLQEYTCFQQFSYLI